LFAARAVIAAAALALISLGALHILKPHPSRNMISLYALGRHGWIMALCFAAFAAASASLVVALATHMPSLPGRIGLTFLLLASSGFAMAARFRMDPVSTPPAKMSFSGKMHGVSFLIGVPCQSLAVLLVSLASGGQTSYELLLGLTAVIWVSLAAMIAIMLMVGPGKAPYPNGPERFLGLPNRLFIVGYAVWLIVAAWPLAS
jgi:hypothetical protein